MYVKPKPEQMELNWKFACCYLNAYKTESVKYRTEEEGRRCTQKLLYYQIQFYIYGL